jgi:hypothetical protein
MRLVTTVGKDPDERCLMIKPRVYRKRYVGQGIQQSLERPRFDRDSHGHELTSGTA